LTGPQTPLTLRDVVGRQAQRALGSGETLQIHDVATVRRETSLLVRPRDIVRVTARKGTLKIALNAAEAIDGGREGDLIRVRNPTSGKIITGRVAGKNELELEL